MNTKPDTEKWIDEALQSLDGAPRASPKPFLFSRVNSRMGKANYNAWDLVLQLISRPAVAIACICIIIAINAATVAFNFPNNKTGTDELYSDVDYNTSVTYLNENDFENPEP
jgi:hypothetical protein